MMGTNAGKYIRRAPIAVATQVVDHTVSTALHHRTVLVRANSFNNVSFRYIEYDACGKFEKHFKESDGTYTGARLFAKSLNLPDKPEIGNVLRDIALGPRKNPKPGSLHAVRGFL